MRVGGGEERRRSPHVVEVAELGEAARCYGAAAVRFLGAR
jgi:hypothetical protein